MLTYKEFIKKYSALKFSLVPFIYITLGLITAAVFYGTIFYQLFYSEVDYHSYWPHLERIFWYLYQVIFFSLYFIALLASLFLVSIKTIWKNIVSWMLLYIAFLIYVSACRSVITYPFYSFYEIKRFFGI